MFKRFAFKDAVPGALVLSPDGLKMVFLQSAPAKPGFFEALVFAGALVLDDGRVWTQVGV